MAVRMRRIPFACSCLRCSSKVCEQWRSICVRPFALTPRFHAIIALLAIYQNTTCTRIYVHGCGLFSLTESQRDQDNHEKESAKEYWMCAEMQLCRALEWDCGWDRGTIFERIRRPRNRGSAEDASLFACSAYLFLFTLLTIIYDYLNFYL